MYIIDPDQAHAKNRFDVVAQPFLQQPGLPFSQVLAPEVINQAFVRHDALFAQDDVFSTQIVLWAFLAQVLRDGKCAACTSAVLDIATYLAQTGHREPVPDTGAYCRARAKLNVAALQDLTVGAAQQLEEAADSSWLWHGRHAKLIDGLTFTLPDTPENRKEFPPPNNKKKNKKNRHKKNKKASEGLPIARACAIVSLATAALCALNFGPYQGKETGESALLRRIIEYLLRGDIAVFDRCLCSFMTLAALTLRGVDFCARLHSRRSVDFRRGKRLGEDDHLVTWTKPRQRPAWMPEALYDLMPETMTVREVRFHLTDPNLRTRTITVVTSLTDPVAYPKEAIAQLFGFRWNVELDIRHIKKTLRLDYVRCKTPAMIRREVWVTLLSYNLIRKLIATAAVVHGKQPRHLGFTMACQAVLSTWMEMATGTCRDAAAMWRDFLKAIASNEVANRPGRVEPRAVKRPPLPYPRLHGPREKAREKLRRKPRRRVRANGARG